LEPALVVAWGVAAAAALGVFLAAAYEVTFAILSRAWLERMQENRVARAVAMLRIHEPPHRLRAIAGIGQSLGTIALTLGLYLGLRAVLPAVWAAALAALLSAICFLGASAAKGLRFEQAGEVPHIPRRALAFVPLHALLLPLANLVERLASASYSPEDLRATKEEELRRMVDAESENGVLEEGERAMIHGVFGFHDSVVREVMVPRVDITAVEQSVPLAELLETIRTAGHSRVPVYEENLDHIHGVAYAKDLLRLLVAHKELDLSVPLKSLMSRPGVLGDEHRLLRDPYYVPETKKTDELFRDFRASRTRLAIVVDEYGGTAGLVALEDLVEEIVGEIQDEYDEEEAFYHWSGSAGELVASARINIDDLNELLETDLPSEGFDTLGGFIYDHLGHIPEQGQVFQVQNLRIELLKVEGHRISQVRIQRLPPTATDEEGGPAPAGAPNG
jgi:CBS domain containing-hemolysin-like protein